MVAKNKILTIFPSLEKIHNQIDITRNIAQINDIFKDEVAALDANLMENCQCKDEALVEEVASYIVSSGGKRIRPLLLFTAANLCESQVMLHVNMATAIELMHTATLLHDDVVDESSQRRGRKSVALNWGNTMSVLVGDFLLGQSLRLMVKQGSLEALTLLSETSTIIARGEITQQRYARNINMPLHIYEEIIAAKTGALFRSATETAAIIAGVSQQKRQALREFGYHLGASFQVTDDVLDIVAGRDLGKKLGQDLKEGKITLPIYYAYKHGSTPFKQAIRHCIENENVDLSTIKDIISGIKQSGAIEMSLDYASELAQKAAHNLEIFPANSSKTLLLNLLEMGLKRSY